MRNTDGKKPTPSGRSRTQAARQQRAGRDAHVEREAAMNDLWYKNAIVYNLDVDSFLDAPR